MRLLNFVVFVILAALTLSTVRAEECADAGVSQPLSIPVKNIVASSERQIYSGSYALVVGASNYKSPWPRLDAVLDETSAVTKSLVAHGFKVFRLCDPTAKGDRGLGEIQKFLKRFGGAENRVLIFLSGHGWVDQSQKQGYFAAVDSPMPPPSILAETKGLSSTQVTNLIKGFQGRHLMVVVDACFSAHLFTRKSPVQAGAISVVDFEEISRITREFLTAGSEGQETPSPSIFTAAFVLGISGYADLNGDGIVRAAELAVWIRDKVANSTGKNTTPRAGTIPVTPEDFGENAGDMVFRYDRTQMPAVFKALLGPGPGAIGGTGYIIGLNDSVTPKSTGLPRKEYTVTYFEKDGDHGAVIEALNKARIPSLIRGTILPNSGATNGIACHPEASGDVVRATARALIESGVKLRIIDRAKKLLSERRYVIQILRFERVNSPLYRDLTLADVDEIKGCPDEFFKTS